MPNLSVRQGLNGGWEIAMLDASIPSHATSLAGVASWKALLRRNQIALRPNRRRKTFNAASGHVSGKIIFKDSAPALVGPLLVRNSTRIANDFKLVMTQNRSGANEMIVAIVDCHH